jgi:hypothetical protein
MGNIQNSSMLQRHLTASYSPQQNVRGREEEPDSDGDGQKHDEGQVTTGLIWGGETVNTAVFLLNRAPTQSVDGKTPYEVWHDVNPPIHFLRTFGFAHVKNGGQ